MTNRIAVVIDATVDKATTAMKGFRTAVADADGVTNKFKAGSTAAFDALKQNAVLGATAAGAAIIAFGVKAVGAASDLDESVNAVNVTFGKASKGILALGEQAAESVGLSNSAFNGLAVQFSSFVDTVVGEGGDVVGTMDDLTHRVADFASVMNIDVPEAAIIFRSALAGESEPIRKYGKDISAAAVTQFALTTGLVETASGMTEAIKVQARYGLLMQETSDVQDDFANTSDGLANQQRILAAKTEDTAAAYGKALKPALEAILPVLEKAVDGAADLAPAFQAASEKISDVVADAKPLIDALGLIASGAGKAADSFQAVDEKTGNWLSKIGGTVFKTAIEKGIFGPVVGTGLEAKDMFDKLFGSTDKAAISLDHLEDRSYTYGTAAEKLIINLDHLDERTQTQTSSTESLAAAEELAAEARDEATKATEDATDALEDQTQATDDLYAAHIALIGGEIGVRDAQREAAAAVAEFNALAEEGTATVDELSASQDNAAETMRAAAEQAAQWAISQAEANGETLSGESKTNLYRLKLEELASTLAPGSPLRVQLQAWIDELKAVPTNIDTRVTLIGGDLLGSVNGKRAAGGPVSAGRSYLVGEQGPELVTMGGNGYVTPNGALNGGGGATVVVNVQTLDGTISTPALSKLMEAINQGIRTGTVKLAAS